MTQESDLLKRFQAAHATTRIACFCDQVMLASKEGVAAVAVTGRLLDPETKVATDKTLWMQLQPPDAYVLAQTILECAKKRGWKAPPGFTVEFISGERDQH
jgi:hypothetical protein